jgi:hypothetical protein
MYFLKLSRREWSYQFLAPLITNAFVSKEASGRHKLSEYSPPAPALLIPKFY